MAGPSQPATLPYAFAYAGLKNSIPAASASPNASYHDGFPAANMTPIADGGVPPAGQDFNGILFAMSAVDSFVSGGGQFIFDPVYAAVAGYAVGARVLSYDATHGYLCLTGGAATSPDYDYAAGGWQADGGYASLSGNCADDTGIANAYVIATKPTITTLYNGVRVIFRAAHANTGACTLNVGPGAVTLVRSDGAALEAGDILGDAAYSAVYIATANKFWLVAPVPSQWSGATTVPSPFANSAAFTSSGSWTAPAGVTRIRLTLIAGGGSGGSSNYSGGAGAGGAGAALRTEWARVTPGYTYTVTVGAGGAAPPGNSDGNSGTPSLFTDDQMEYITYGGIGGKADGIGGDGGFVGNIVMGTGASGGAGGAAGSNAVTFNDLYCGQCFPGAGGGGYGHIGGGTGLIQGGPVASATANCGGGGGSSCYGQGGTGVTSGTPATPSAYGAGGGGSGESAGGGGAGAGGYCLIEY
jgi:hypothetical protein